MHHEILLTLLPFVISVSGFSLNPRIVGGEYARANEFPEIVSLRVSHRHICGATILNENFVLTAAHCVQLKAASSLYSVQYGLTRIIEGPYAPNVVRVSRLVPHEKYIPVIMFFGLRNDLAIVELAKPVKFGSNVQPTKLPIASSTFEHRMAVAAGWGLSDTGGDIMQDLQKVDLMVYSDVRCENDMYSSNRVYHICAGVPEGHKGVCNGDSGGPLIVDGVQIGIVSWSTKECALEGYPGVFTKISSYVGWIEEMMKSEPSKSNGFFSSIFNYLYNLFY